MLRFIEGTAGSGKTEYARTLATELSENGQKVFLVVPKQYSFESERALLFRLGDEKAGEIEVLSFARMKDRIQHEFGGYSVKRLDDCGRSIYMSMALENVRKDLELYGKQYRNPDFIALMLKTVTECKMCTIQPETLEATAKDMPDGMLKGKTSDVAKIYKEYNSLIDSGFIDPEDDMEELCNNLKKKPLFEGANVIFDSFNRLTEQEARIVEQIMRQATNVWFTVCCDPTVTKTSGVDIFADTLRMKRRIIRAAKENGISVGESVVLQGGSRFKNDELKTVEENIFRARHKIYPEAPKYITVAEAANRYEESDWVARKIRQLIRENGWRYNDFVVILRNESDFSGILDATFEKFGLPYFMDLPSDVNDSSIMVTATAALESVLCGKKDASATALDTEALLRCLKAGLCGFSVKEIAELENYIFVWGIDGEDWNKEWTGHPDGYSAPVSEKSAEKLRKLNGMRESVCKHFFTLAEGMKNSSGMQKAKSLYAFLATGIENEDANIHERMMKMSAEMEISAFESVMLNLYAAASDESKYLPDKIRNKWEELKQTGRSLEQRQDALWEYITYVAPSFAERNLQKWQQSKRTCSQPAEDTKRHWDLLMTIINQAGMILRDKEIDGKTFLQLLQVAISTASMSYIPKSLDCITVGSADRIRPASPKAIFVIGANQGVFPSVPASSGVFSDKDRHQLNTLGVELFESLETQIVEERFSAYTAVSSPSQLLFVSYSAADPSGAGMLPSEIVNELKRIFPQMPIISAQRNDAEPEFIEEAFETLAANFGYDNEMRALLFKDFSSRDGYKETIEAIERAEKLPVRFRDKTNARQLFGNVLNLSATQVETYYKCPFMYFCRYGMRAGTLRKAQIDALEYGTLVHYALENMLLRHPNKEDLLSLDESTLQSEVEGLLNGYLENNLGGKEGKSKRFMHTYNRYAMVIVELMHAMLDDFRQNSFEPADVELQIGQAEWDERDTKRIPSLELELPEDGKLRVFGKVDRVDKAIIDGKTYLRIMDYKTGTREFALCDVLFGLDMQMVIYLLTITEKGSERYGEIIPAGVLYVPSKTPKISIEHGTKDEELQSRKRRQLRMSGIVRGEEEVIRAMEPTVAGEFIPVTYKKDMTFDKHSQTVSAEEMDLLFGHVTDKLSEMGNNLRNGEIPKRAVKGACQYCEFASVCGHESRDKTYDLPRLKKDQVFETIKRKNTEKI